MRSSRRLPSFVAFSAISFSAVLILGLARVHLRMQTTLLGYDLGQLKGKENSLIAYRSNRRVELAKLSTKQSLEALSNQTKTTRSLGDYAAQ